MQWTIGFYCASGEHVGDVEIDWVFRVDRLGQGEFVGVLINRAPNSNRVVLRAGAMPSADDELGLGLGRPLGDVDHVRDPVLPLPTFRVGRRTAPGPVAGGAGRVVLLGALFLARSRPA
jgi:hypothetical protein